MKKAVKQRMAVASESISCKSISTPHYPLSYDFGTAKKRKGTSYKNHNSNTFYGNIYLMRQL